MVFLEIIGLVAATAALTRVLRQGPAAAGLRAWVRARSRLLDQLVVCPHCLSFWIAAAGTALLWGIRGMTVLELGLFVLLGWRGAYYVNRSLDQRRERDDRRAGQSCAVCEKPYEEEVFLERQGLPFCSPTCWFDYLRSRPLPHSQLVGRSGEILRQEVYPMSYKDITNEEAQALLDGDDGHVYVDVRSVPEFQNGHPAGAVNVPIMHREAFGMVPNPDFLTVLEAHFPRDAKLLIGCQSGQRSVRAAEALVAVGFKDVSNVKGGFGGVRQGGQVVEKGWFELGLPTDSGEPEGRSYASLAGGRSAAS